MGRQKRKRCVMARDDALPELKQIVGGLIFGANRPLGLNELRRCLVEVGDLADDAAIYAQVKNGQIHDAVEELQRDLERAHVGFSVAEVAGGYRLQSDAACGRWLKHLLQTKPQRLSRPALETLAIIAYRQPISRADLEAVRGVDVSHVIKALMEAQLVRIAGRSELPGRPFLYGTTHAFLEHFGLRELKDLNKMAPMVLMRREGMQATARPAPDGAAPPPTSKPPAAQTPELPLDAPTPVAATEDVEAAAAEDGES